MGAALGKMLGVKRTPKGSFQGFRKQKVGRTTFFAAECVAFTAEQLGAGRRRGLAAAEKKSTPRWSGGKVPYRFISSFTPQQKNLFKAAAKMWEDATGAVRFIEDVNKEHAVHVRVSKLAQQKNLASNGAVADAFIKIGHFNQGSIAHELGHVLGLVHEHQRFDRDGFVTVDAAVAGDPNFRLHAASEDKIRTDYDFESIMHYGAQVVLNGAVVDALKPKPGFTQFKNKMGQRSRISAKDKDAIRAMYGA